MATRKSSRKAKSTQRPLDDEFLWDDISGEQAWPEYSALSAQLGNAPSATKRKVSPDSRAAKISEPTTLDCGNLKLLKETHELEITKLKLQLELATLSDKTTLFSPAGTNDSSAKSQGDLRAPQRTLHPQPWPHIYAPGEPKLYTELSLAAFTAGYLSIVHNTHDANIKQNLLEHLKYLMTLSCTYQWHAIRSLHYKVLRSLEMGLVQWGDSFDSIAQPFLIPPNLLSETSKPAPNRTNTPKFATSSAIPRSQICDEWSWYDSCSEDQCPKQHICLVCKRADHQARNCPKRKYAVPPRRQDTTPRD